MLYFLQTFGWTPKQLSAVVKRVSVSQGRFINMKPVDPHTVHGILNTKRDEEDRVQQLTFHKLHFECSSGRCGIWLRAIRVSAWHLTAHVRTLDDPIFI